MRHTERDLERRCCDFARRHGILAVKLEKDGHVGIPDRVFIFEGGRVLFVEFKRPDGKGRTTREQRYFADFLGERHIFCCNFEEFCNTLKQEIKR